MAGIPLHSFLDHLRQLHGNASAEQRSDRELLHAFIHHNDQDAFAAVLRRHAALVWGVCRRILGHQQDAEDVFQATFLILARRAGAARWRSSVGGWLHTVAQRLAVRVRKREQRRRLREHEADRMPQAESSLRELAATVDEQLRRLPEKYREPLLLHYLEGMTAEEAARQLGVSRSTFYDRLHRGRELLRVRLSRQGLSLAAPLLAASLMQEAEAAAPSLIQSAMRGAMEGASQHVASLAAEAMPVTAMVKGKIALALGLLLGVAAGGTSMLMPRASITPPPQPKRHADSSETAAKPEARRDRFGDPLPPGAVARLGTLRFRAPDEIKFLAFAPDGKTIAVSSPAGVFLFDAASGKRIDLPAADARRQRDWEHSLVFSPDSKRLAASGRITAPGDRFRDVLFVWDLTGRQTPRQFDAENAVWLGWSAEGEPLALYQETEALRLQELVTGRSRRFECKEPSGGICAPASRTLIAVEGRGVVHVWDMATGRERRSFRIKDASTPLLILSADGRTLALRHGGKVQLWDVVTGKASHTVATDQKFLSFAVFSPDGKMLATSGWTGVRFWDVATGRERSRIQGPGSDTERAVAFAPDGRTFVTGDRHGRAIHLWDVATGRRKHEPAGHLDRPHGTAFAPDGRRVATADAIDGTIYFWDAESGKALSRIQRPGRWVCGIAFAPDGRSLFSTWTDDELWISDAAHGDRRHVLKLEDPDRPDTRQSAISLSRSTDGKRLVVLSAYEPKKNGAGPRYSDTLITGWDTTTSKQLFRRRRPGMDFSLSLSPDARLLAAPPPSRREEGKPGIRSGKGPMRLEDTATGDLLLMFPTLKGPTWPLAFSPDGRLLASSEFDGTRFGKDGQHRGMIHLWETATAARVLSLPGIDLNNRVAFSPDGRLLALTAPGREILVWDLRSGRERRRFKGFDADVTDLAFSPDCRRLVSGLTDSTLLVWDVGTHDPSPIRLGKTDADKAWHDLADPDAAQAFRARGTLAAAPAEALALLKKHLHPVKPADPQRLSRLLADLDSERFSARDKAQAELEKLHELAEPALRKALANKPTLEARRRVQALLDRLRGPVTRTELLRALRALAVLEDIGTPAARRLLEELATGAPEARLTREAKAALRRH